MEIHEGGFPSSVETALTGEIKEVTMHPLVLLSAADHYHRVARGTRKRVVGVLLGSVSKGVVDCSNSFAVPFEEDSKNAVSFIFSRENENDRSDTIRGAIAVTIAIALQSTKLCGANYSSFICYTSL